MKADNVPKNCSLCGRPFKDRDDWNRHGRPDDCVTHLIGYTQALEAKIERLEAARGYWKDRSVAFHGVFRVLQGTIGSLLTAVRSDIGPFEKLIKEAPKVRDPNE